MKICVIDTVRSGGDGRLAFNATLNPVYWILDGSYHLGYDIPVGASASKIFGDSAEIASGVAGVVTIAFGSAGITTGIRGAWAGTDGAAAHSNLATVTTHLESIDALASHPPNAAMVRGIEDAIASGRPLTAAEQNFMTHELTEAHVVASGASQDVAHAAALETHPPFMNYSPEVIQNFPEYFNSN